MDSRHAFGFRRMSRCISVFLAAFLALAVFMPPNSHAQAAQQDTLSGITYLEVPETHWGGPTVESRLTIHSVRTEGTRVELSGQVNYAGELYPVEIDGQFYASGLGSGGDKVASATDRTGNFQVIHFALRRNPPSEARLYSTASGPILYLYLQREGTREVTVVEASVNDLRESRSLVRLLQGNAERGHFGTDYWQPKLFRPYAPAGMEDAIGIQAEQDNDVETYSEGRYSVGTNGCWVEYWIKFQAYANGPSDIGQGSADFNHKLEILDKWTASNCAFYESGDSPYVLGKYADPVRVKIKAYGNGSDKGDVLLKGRYNGHFVTKTSFASQVQIGLGLSFKVASISWSHPLCCWTDVDKEEEYVFSQSDPDEWTKLADYAYSDRYLPDEGMYFQAIVQNAWGTGSRSERYLSARWTVPIYADYDDLSTTLYYKTTRTPQTTLYYYSG